MFSAVTCAVLCYKRKAQATKQNLQPCPLVWYMLNSPTFLSLVFLTLWVESVGDAGYETTSVALSYALYEMARHPAVQQQLQAEVDAFGRRDKEPNYADLSAFPYTEAVFQEGMRLHPPVTPFIALVSPTISLSWASVMFLHGRICSRLHLLNALRLGFPECQGICSRTQLVHSLPPLPSPHYAF